MNAFFPDPNAIAAREILAERQRAALLRDAEVDRASRWSARKINAVGWGLIVFIILILAWYLPRLYKPKWIEVSHEDSRRIVFCQRHWFSATERIELEARFNRELEQWQWMAKDRKGEYYPFFREEE